MLYYNYHNDEVCVTLKSLKISILQNISLLKYPFSMLNLQLPKIPTYV
jgi:hypothetical protein